MSDAPGSASAPDSTELPLLTADLAGTGGEIEQLEDFVVEELPAYLPCGAGEHCMILIEKRGLTTPQAINRLCHVLGQDPRQAGYAGLKDKQGVTRQWISIAGVQPTDVTAVELPELTVLRAELHRNKIRTGHLRGNRFTVVLRGTGEDGVQRARLILDRLTQAGLPNYYGEQRFGREGDNAVVGLRLLRGEAALPRDRFKRRLLLSAAQSALFNAVLADRLQRNLLRRLVGGEVLQRTDSAGLFVSEQTEVDQLRLDRGELVITGPMVGPRMPLALENSPARKLEQEIFDAHRVDPAALSRLGRLARGGRRPLTVPVHDAVVEPCHQGETLKLSFALPAGTYATVLLREVSKRASCRG